MVRLGTNYQHMSAHDLNVAENQMPKDGMVTIFTCSTRVLGQANKWLTRVLNRIELETVVENSLKIIISLTRLRENPLIMLHK